jgi:hypothetical protein
MGAPIVRATADGRPARSANIDKFGLKAVPWTQCRPLDWRDQGSSGFEQPENRTPFASQVSAEVRRGETSCVPGSAPAVAAHEAPAAPPRIPLTARREVASNADPGCVACVPGGSATWWTSVRQGLVGPTGVGNSVVPWSSRATDLFPREVSVRRQTSLHPDQTRPLHEESPECPDRRLCRPG